MEFQNKLTRRKFIASTSALVATAQLGIAGGAETGADAEKLAVEGGPKTIPGPMPKPVRWGAPELEQLGAAVKQPSLYYWRNQQTKLLTERFQKFYDHKYVQPCSSGTASLHIAVAAAGIAPGDEVITSSITDIGTVVGVLFQQAVPVFADVDQYTGLLDPADVEQKITPKTRVIIAVHLAGNPCKLEELRDIADKHKLILIEDCAQAWGTLYKGKPISMTGEISCFSLQDSKLITTGDGGVVTTSSAKFGPLLIKFGDKGTNRLNLKDTNNALGANYRMNELSAAFAASQLTRLEGIAEKRSQLGRVLTEALTGIPGIVPHPVNKEDRCTYWFYLINFEPSKFKCDRAAFVKAVVAEGATVTAGYIATPLYGQPMFQEHSFFAGHWPVKEMGLTKMDYSKVKCPNTEALIANAILFRLNEAMDDNYVTSVARAVRKVAKHYAV